MGQIVESPEEYNEEGGEEEEQVYDDDIYETIEAPKFIDFTLPDRPLPDDRSWFCLRIGCDQKHEDIDPDALHKSFVLRVMAARSPHLRLRKALSKQDTSATKKCPLSAPAKPSKPRMARMTEITLVPQKIFDANGKAHPISRLYSTPIQKAKQSSVAAKALTTPRYKKAILDSNPFRSVQNPKQPSAVQKKKLVAKALVFNSPKKIEKNKTALDVRTPVSEICAGMKKLGINSQCKKPSRDSRKPSRVVPCSINKSVTASGSSKTKLYTPKSRSQVKVSQDCKEQETKSVRYLKENESLQKAHSSQPQDITDNDFSEMEIDRKSRISSLAVCSVTGSVSNKERKANEECLIVLQEKVGATNSTQQECFPSSGTSSIRESGEAYSADVSSYNHTSSLSNSESNLEGNVDDNIDSKHERNVDLTQKEETAPEEQESIPNRTGIEIETKDDADKENTTSLSDIRNLNENEHVLNIDSTQKELNSSEEQEKNMVVQFANRTQVENEANGSNDKENATASDENRNLNPISDSDKKSGQHKACGNHKKLTDGHCKTTTFVSTVGANGSVGGKHMKTMLTKPKPFRLRTDERGVLRETNLERHLRAPRKDGTLVQSECNLQKKHGSVQQAKPTRTLMSKSVLAPKTREIRMKKAEVGTWMAGRTLEYQRTTKSQLMRQQLTRPQRATDTSNKTTSVVAPIGLSVLKESSSTTARRKVPSRYKIGLKADKNVSTITANPSTAPIGRCSSGRRAAAVPREKHSQDPYTKGLHKHTSAEAVL